MLGKLLAVAAGVGFGAGIITTGKIGGVKRKVENTIRPKRNKVAHIKVHLEDDVDPEDLRFIVVQPTRNKASPTDVSNAVEDYDFD